jgi:hypothetical protein
MSATQVLATLGAALADPDTGLAAKCAAVVAVLGAPYDAVGAAEVDRYVRTDFTFGKWQLRDALSPGNGPQVICSTDRQRAVEMAAASVRDADTDVRVDYEGVFGDADRIQDNLTVVWSALLQVIDGLVRFAQANGGTIVDVHDPITVEFGRFRNSPTHGGFSATFTLRERSTL